MKRRGFPIPLALLATVLAAGCTHYVSPEKKLQRAVASFNDGVRWQHWESAASHLPPGERTSFIRAREAEGESLRITDYEIRNVQRDEIGDKATVSIEFVWHRYPSLTMHRTRVTQTWEYKESTWLRTSQEEAAPEEEEEPKGFF